MTEQKRKALERLLMAEAARRGDYTEYCRLVYRGAWKPAKHHLLISDALQRVMSGQTKRLMVFMPPRHGKSMQITETLPSFFLGHKPDSRVISISYGDELAVRFGRSNRQKVAEYGQEIFGITVAKKVGSAKAWDIEGRRGGMLSVGLGGAITGQGADLLIIDDPVRNREDAESKIIRDKTFDEYQSTAYTRLQAGGAIVIVQTRWHEDDLSGRLLAGEEGHEWEVLNLPAEAEENDLLGREIGDPLWPEQGYDKDWVRKTKLDVGSYTWASLYQQRPAPLAGGVFQREWWKWYDNPPEMLAVILSVDAAFKATADSDYVSIQAWGKRNADMYLLDSDTRRMDFPETMNAIRAMHQKHRPRAVYVEDKANGSAIISVLQKEISGIIPVEPKGGKLSRAHAVSPSVESGNVWLPRNRIGDEMMEEAAGFPHGMHDDRVDAMTQALNQLIYHWAEVEKTHNTVEWEIDQWEDYYISPPEVQSMLIEKWGNPF